MVKYKLLEIKEMITSLELNILNQQTHQDCLKSFVDRTCTESFPEWLKISAISVTAFGGCENLTEVTIPNGVVNIGDYAFWCCRNITNTTIPSSVTNIGNRAFGNCDKLANVYLRKSTPPSLYNQYAIPDTTTIHVPIGSGNAYKSATNWSYHSARIVEDIEI